MPSLRQMLSIVLLLDSVYWTESRWSTNAEEQVQEGGGREGGEESNLRGSHWHRRDTEASQTGTVYNFDVDSDDTIPSASPSACIFTADEFQTEVLLTMNGNPELVTRNDLELVQSTFVRSYNNIAGGLCDDQFRFVVDVGNETFLTPNSTNTTDNGLTWNGNETEARRQLEPQTNTGFTKFAFRFFVLGICRGCPTRSRIFNDGFRRHRHRRDLISFDNPFAQSGGGTANHLSSYMTGRAFDPANLQFTFTIDPTNYPSFLPSLPPSMTASVVPSTSPSLRSSLSPSAAPSLFPSWNPNTYSCNCLADSSLDNRAAGINEFQIAFNETISYLNANGNLSHIGEIVGVKEVESIDCGGVNNFTSQVIIAVSGDTDNITSVEMDEFGNLVLAVYDQTLESYCDPLFRKLNGIEEIVVEGTRRALSDASFGSFGSTFFSSISSFTSGGIEPSNTPSVAPIPAATATAGNDRYRPFQFRLVIRGTCRGCPEESRIFDDGFRRNLRVEEEMVEMEETLSFTDLIESSRRLAGDVEEDLCICPKDAEEGIPGELTFRSIFQRALIDAKEEGRFPNIDTEVFEAIQVDDYEPSAAPSESPTTPSAFPSPMPSDAPSDRPSESPSPSDVPTVSQVPTDSPVPSPSPSMLPTVTVKPSIRP